MKPRQLLRELQREQKAREPIRKRDARQPGHGHLEAGFGEWHALEVMGGVPEATERIGDSPTPQLAVRILAEGHLCPLSRPERGLQKPASEPGAAAEPQDDGNAIAARLDAEREPGSACASLHSAAESPTAPAGGRSSP